MKVDELDAMSEENAADALRLCCGSSRWIDEMVAKRPFRSAEHVFAAADEAWSGTVEQDWREAFSHHPRIGDRRPAAAQSSRAASWSGSEQGGVRWATATIQAEMARVNKEYEDRFGHIYIVCATGKSPEEMLAIATERLSNDPETELRVAAEEQRKITRLRLRKLLGDST